MTPLTLVRPRSEWQTQIKEATATRIVPCGKCILCLKRRQSSWTFRLNQQQKISQSSCFITLTYEDTPLSQSGTPTLSKTDFQRFIKRLRKKHITSQSKTTLKYYACGEYGNQYGRPHYHAIMFNMPQNWIKKSDTILKAWGLGHIFIAPCTNGRINYVTKYILKSGKSPIDYETGEIYQEDRVPEFSLMSKNMGLNYLTPQMVKYHIENQISHVTLSGGTLTSLPRYYRDKIFSEREKYLLNIEAEKIRKFNFEKLFNSSYHNEVSWKKAITKKAEKKIQQERGNLKSNSDINSIQTMCRTQEK